ncbi:MAG TPA: hypothetical protein ENJ94_07090 [Gammaproteobacteria bacterium]|nr:hypothetical protein [Gammaproteobacteria bacterium]
MKRHITATLIPPVGACRYGCGTSCAAPITVFWLFGVISVVYGLLGGPTNEPGVSWYTVGLGVVMWGIAAVWTLVTLQGVEADRCHDLWSPRDHQVAADEREPDPFEEVKKAH